MAMPPSQEMSCGDLEHEITAYMEGALSAPDRDRFEAHYRSCPACRLLVAQWQTMVGWLGHLEDRPKGATGAEKERALALFREHGFHREGRPDPRVPLGFDSELAAPGDHISYFCASEQDFAAMAGFVAAGAAQGESCILLGHDEANERLDSAIRGTGLDAATLRREDRLRFVRGMRSGDALFHEVADQVSLAVDRGAPLVRILGNLGWGRPDWPADRDLLRLEARLTDAVQKLPVIVVCAYDIRDVAGPNLLRGGLECHPLTFHRNALRLNPLYLPAESFLAGTLS